MYGYNFYLIFTTTITSIFFFDFVTFYRRLNKKNLFLQNINQGQQFRKFILRILKKEKY